MPRELPRPCKRFARGGSHALNSKSDGVAGRNTIPFMDAMLGNQAKPAPIQTSEYQSESTRADPISRSYTTTLSLRPGLQHP